MSSSEIGTVSTTELVEEATDLVVDRPVHYPVLDQKVKKDYAV